MTVLINIDRYEGTNNRNNWSGRLLFAKLLIEKDMKYTEQFVISIINTDRINPLISEFEEAES